MEIILLTEKFFEDHANTPELMRKSDRPYLCLYIEVDGKTYAIPLRHHINHPFAFITIGESGLDFSKSVVVEDPAYVSATRPRIDDKEWSIIKRQSEKIRSEFVLYLGRYRRALKDADRERNKYILQYSTLRYFDI